MARRLIMKVSKAFLSARTGRAAECLKSIGGSARTGLGAAIKV
jgi:hypothetical protein